MDLGLYFDSAASTPIAPCALESIASELSTSFANSQSLHQQGLKSARTIEESRYLIASHLNAEFDEIVFTSGGSESNNWIIQGLLLPGDHIITGKVEHKSLLAPIEQCFKKMKIEVTYLPVDHLGRVSKTQLESAVKSNTKLVSIIHGNNEISTLNDIASLFRGLPDRIFVHSDACQSFGRTPIDVSAMRIDALSINSHKIYGPKGVGALYLKRKWHSAIEPLVAGGKNQNLRTGTLNPALIKGFSQGLKFVQQNGVCERESELSQILKNKLKEKVPTVRFLGDQNLRLSHILCVNVPGLNAKKLFRQLNQHQIAVSLGSACSTQKASHVLEEIGLTESEINSTFRISTHYFMGDSDIDHFVSVIVSLLLKKEVYDPGYN